MSKKKPAKNATPIVDDQGNEYTNRVAKHDAQRRAGGEERISVSIWVPAALKANKTEAAAVRDAMKTAGETTVAAIADQGKGAAA